MKKLSVFCASAFAFTASGVAAEKSPVLQTVDLTDRGMSTEGGEATLARINGGKGGCRIDVVHYGETGKATLAFEFGPELREAEAKQFRYERPIYEGPIAKVTLTERTTLASPEGRKKLAKDFEEYKSFFDAGQLAKCLAR